MTCLSGNSLVYRGGLQSPSMFGYQSTCHLACSSCMCVHIHSPPCYHFILALLCISSSHSLHFSGAGKGGGNSLQGQHNICCPDSKQKGRQSEQTTCGTGKRQTRTNYWNFSESACTFLLMSVASYHPMWSQLQRKSRQTPFGFEFPQKEDGCLVSPAQEGIWKTARPCLAPFFPLLPILFFRCFHVFPVETATGAEHLWFQITVVELQSTQHHCLET